ncbi:MAG: hypothetical protein HFJ52_00180 [Clostridia bacterium]|jgi:hypothetical protein|nr:hypothetical protein [Clostridia bacterium]
MNKKPRWINEIPLPSEKTNKRKLNEEEEKEAKEFEEAVKNGKISEWLKNN